MNDKQRWGMRVFAVILVLMGALWPAMSGAQDWKRLDGAQIEALLTGAKVTYGSARQNFFAQGRTLYNAGRGAWGYWAVRDDQYCSQWPPSETWTCYEVTANGDSVRFIADGVVTQGRLQPGE